MSSPIYKNIFDGVMIELTYRMNRYKLSHLEIKEELPEFIDIQFLLEHIKNEF